MGSAHVLTLFEQCKQESQSNSCSSSVTYHTFSVCIQDIDIDIDIDDPVLEFEYKIGAIFFFNDRLGQF